MGFLTHHSFIYRWKKFEKLAVCYNFRWKNCTGLLEAKGGLNFSNYYHPLIQRWQSLEGAKSPCLSHPEANFSRSRFQALMRNDRTRMTRIRRIFTNEAKVNLKKSVFIRVICTICVLFTHLHLKLWSTEFIDNKGLSPSFCVSPDAQANESTRNYPNTSVRKWRATLSWVSRIYNSASRRWRFSRPSRWLIWILLSGGRPSLISWNCSRRRSHWR